MKTSTLTLVASLICLVHTSSFAQKSKHRPARQPITPANQHPGEQPVDPALLSQKLPHIEIVGGARSANFGRVLPGDHYLQFTVRNNGGATLVFYGPDNSCKSCLSYDYDKGSLESGDTMRMTMHFTLENYNGTLDGFAVINSNDPQTPRLEVPVHIEVYRAITMTPTNAIIQDFKPCKDECHFTFELKNTGDSSVTISSPTLVKAEGMEVRFSMKEGTSVKLKPGATYKLEAYAKITERPQEKHPTPPSDIAAEPPYDMFVPHADAEIHTSSRTMPVIPIPFYYLISGK